jgi:hypothetical protein
VGDARGVELGGVLAGEVAGWQWGTRSGRGANPQRAHRFLQASREDLPLPLPLLVPRRFRLLGQEELAMGLGEAAGAQAPDSYLLPMKEGQKRAGQDPSEGP